MAAGVIEAIELGAKSLLFDEDSCATNFLIRECPSETCPSGARI
jgi:predicted ABC-class ATPase